ncbi:hypothetical protein CYMTET_29802, partial [Cymbomonas tetramitiformis]
MSSLVAASGNLKKEGGSLEIFKKFQYRVFSSNYLFKARDKREKGDLCPVLYSFEKLTPKAFTSQMQQPRTPLAEQRAENKRFQEKPQIFFEYAAPRASNLVGEDARQATESPLGVGMRAGRASMRRQRSSPRWLPAMFLLWSVGPCAGETINASWDYIQCINITCCDKDTQSTSLRLYSNSLTGTVPTELGRLTQLKWYIKLNNNSLTGPLPTELGLLYEMTSFFLPLDGNAPLGAWTHHNSHIALRSCQSPILRHSCWTAACHTVNPSKGPTATPITVAPSTGYLTAAWGGRQEPDFPRLRMWPAAEPRSHGEPDLCTRMEVCRARISSESVISWRVVACRARASMYGAWRGADQSPDAMPMEPASHGIASGVQSPYISSLGISSRRVVRCRARDLTALAGVSSASHGAAVLW